MQWNEIRERYPNQWLLVEAIDARTDTGKRVLDELSVIDTFDDSAEALRRYQELHRQARDREYYVLHTSRVELDITEHPWFGIRL